MTVPQLTKRKKIEWIAETFNVRLDRAIKLVDQIREKYDPDPESDLPVDLPHEPLTQEYWNLVQEVLDEIRDEYFCSQKIGENLWFATVRLRRRGKI